MALSLDQLEVTSFETTAPVTTHALLSSGGEDCFSYRVGCLPQTFTTRAD
jgi:hypothetical protein